MKRKRANANAGMLIGDARVSTYEQHLDLQRDALRKAGCGKIFKKVALARVMHSDKHVAINDICATLGIGRATLYRYLNAPPGGPQITRGCNHETDLS